MPILLPVQSGCPAAGRARNDPVDRGLWERYTV